MVKRIAILFVALFGLFILGGCTQESTGYTLPNLVGMTETEARSSFSGLPITLIVKTEENDSVETGIFSRYGGDYAAGDEVAGGTMITLYFALNYPKLPDLTGMTSSEAQAAMTSAGILFTVSICTDNTVEDQTFSHYGNGLVIGDAITVASTVVTIYIGYNDPKLPDLTGLLKAQIEEVLEEQFIAYQFAYVTDDQYAEDSFANYQGYEIGDFYSSGVVTVNLYQNTFTSNETSLFISQYVDGGNDTTNQAIDIYNPTDTAVALADYKLVIYANGSDTITYIIPLDNVSLAPGETYTVVRANADAALLAKADLTNANLIFDGNDCIQLVYKNGTYIDTIFSIGNMSFLMDDEVFIRNKDVVKGTRTFSLSQWDAYIPTYIDEVGQFPVDKPTTLTFEFIDRPFGDPLGGMTKVTLVYTYDGDTAGFTPGFTDEARVRFLGVDTPESYPIAEDWGLEAKAYTTSVLNAAVDIYIQSDPNSGATDNYGRSLGLIWIDGTLLNYELVRLGYSHNYLGTDCKLVFGNRYLYRWFQDAEAEAIANGLGIHS
ncbi:MAG: lamin tail domain-containing protein [Candidatus Izemoplasmatales bacterium]